MKIRGDDALNRLRLPVPFADGPRHVSHRRPASAQHLFELGQPRPPGAVEQSVQALTRDPHSIRERTLGDLVGFEVLVDRSRDLILNASGAGRRIRVVRTAPQPPFDEPEPVEVAFNVEARLVDVVPQLEPVLYRLLVQGRILVSMLTQCGRTGHVLRMHTTDAYIANYTARIDPTAWAEMQEFVRGTIRFRYASGRGAWEVEFALTTLSSFADWALFTGVGEMDDRILDAAVIDSYTLFRESEVLPSVAARERKLLRTIAGIPNTTEFDRTPTTTPVSQPYTAAEQGAIRRWAETQPTAQRRKMCGAIVALALGAGLTSGEVMNARESDIVILEDGLTGVRVGERLVPVIEEWNDLLTPYAASEDEVYVVSPGFAERAGRRLSKIMGRAPSKVWQPVPQRMRNTWLIRCLDAGVPLQNVVDAAGLESPEMLRRLIPFMAKLEGSAAVSAFRIAGEVAVR
ncbi:MAG: hypothetical protein IJG47_06535 [Microbacterium sp.]|nr:hypothetical protein [Microbacterium sp.]